MAKKSENQFIASVHKYLWTNELYAMKNNNQYNGGIADCWYSGCGQGSKDLWIEWKFNKLPARDATLIEPDLSALQRDWLTSRHAEGRHVWVAIGCEKGGVILYPGEWDTPLTTAQFRRKLLARKELAAAISAFVRGKQ